MQLTSKLLIFIEIELYEDWIRRMDLACLLRSLFSATAPERVAKTRALKARLRASPDTSHLRAGQDGQGQPRSAEVAGLGPDVDSVPGSTTDQRTEVQQRGHTTQLRRLRNGRLRRRVWRLASATSPLVFRRARRMRHRTPTNCAGVARCAAAGKSADSA
jgi:hypothetical protein